MLILTVWVMVKVKTMFRDWVMIETKLKMGLGLSFSCYAYSLDCDECQEWCNIGFRVMSEGLYY